MLIITISVKSVVEAVCLVYDRGGRGTHTGSEAQVTPADQVRDQTPKRKTVFSWREEVKMGKRKRKREYLCNIHV